MYSIFILLELMLRIYNWVHFSMYGLLFEAQFTYADGIMLLLLKQFVCTLLF
jgi:hypothetical protein